MSDQVRRNGLSRRTTASWSVSFTPSALSVLFILAELAFLFFAFSDIRQSAQFADIFFVAERLEQSEKVNVETLTKTAAKTDDIVSGDYCRSDIIMAGTTLVLNRLDTANEITDYNAWANAADDAERYIRHAVSCMPTDSNIWLRLAIVRAVIVQEPKSIAALMSMSARLAPNDELALVARIYFWNRLNVTTLEYARTAVETDLSTLLNFGNSRKTGALLNKISPALLPFVKTAAAKLTADRKSSLVWFGADIGKLE